ncbi:hypothetical protein DFP72DRAFT_1167266 [Ephemerocybe angulata]|uniref:Uncharacterized protein n=1 Tax=Ephemerocybe angulata TaxID=980116 RepID=A0A8H6M7P1_9AGAR|nr:hypothetical protein DFP72DRAFT_1167266 [Tulosesus angulatus]
MPTLHALVKTGLIRPNLRIAAIELNAWALQMQQKNPEFSYFAVGGLGAALCGQRRVTRDIDLRLSHLGKTEKLSMRNQPDWDIWSNPKTPNKIKAIIRIDEDPDRVKVDAVLVQPTDLAIYRKHNLINTIDGISVANPALLAITKLETLAVRGNTVKLPNDYLDLIWCLEELKEQGLEIPEEALEAGFPAGWEKMYARLGKAVEPAQVDILMNLLLELGIKP